MKNIIARFVKDQSGAYRHRIRPDCLADRRLPSSPTAVTTVGNNLGNTFKNIGNNLKGT